MNVSKKWLGRSAIITAVFLLWCGFGACKSKGPLEPSPIALPDTVDTLSPLPNKPAAFVEIVRLDSTIVLDIKYATTDNFTNDVLYPEARCFSRLCMAESLISVNRKAKEMGYRIKVFDCYRPHRVQFKMWELVPDSRYVANPHQGSRHNRGTAVDLTLIDSAGNELDMGSEFDEFSKRSHRGYGGLTKEQRKNRKLLTSLMTSTGFTSITSEWWHFDYYDWKKFPLINVSFDSLRFISTE